jgi:hypothetical protein
MSHREIIELQDARPFHPFELTLSDGSRVVIAHPKWMLLTPDGRTLHCVFRDAPSRRVDLDHVTQAVVLENAAAGEFVIRN